MKDTIIIEALEVQFRVGVPDEERRHPQKLLISLYLEKDFRPAADRDEVALTVDYDALTRQLIAWGERREWKLIETLASDLAQWVLASYAVEKIRVEIKKFILPHTQYVGVCIERKAP